MINIEKFNFGDEVIVTRECSDKGRKGIVVETYADYITVSFCDGLKVYNRFSLRKIDDVREDINMTGFNKVAIVNLLEDYSKKDYAFALYDEEYKLITSLPRNLVVVNPRDKNNRVLGILKDVMSLEKYGKNVTAQVVGVVNMNGFIAREDEERRLKEVAKRKAEIEKELEEEIKKRKSVEYYEEMSRKYSDNPRLAELVSELKELGA